MPAETDLPTMLATLDVNREPGVFVFATVADARAAAALPCCAIVREREAWTVVLKRDDALQHGIFFDFEAVWLTLSVHSALASVGLTAAVARALADEQIPCNVLAGYHHDHLLVPEESAERAIDVLRALRGRAAA
jgi:uncharacterized protein